MRVLQLSVFLFFCLAVQGSAELPCTGQTPARSIEEGRVCFGGGANAVLTSADGNKTKLLFANFWTDARFKRREKKSNVQKGLVICREYFSDLVAFGTQAGTSPEKIEIRLFWLNRAPRVPSDYRGNPAVGRVIVSADVRDKTCEFVK